MPSQWPAGPKTSRSGAQSKELAWLNDPPKLARLKELGYTKLVLMNTSPFIVSLGVVTGMQAEHAVDLPQQLPAVAANWPVVINSPLVLIVEIPK